MGYSQQIRFEGAYSRGDNDMDVGSLEAWEAFLAQASPQEVSAFYEGIHAGANGEDVPLCPPCEGQDEPLDALYRKGKGKGKGKRGKEKICEVLHKSLQASAGPGEILFA